MAYVIAVCGSGGKTTLVKGLAKKYANENKKVCITTTTHMWYDDDVKESLIVGTNANTVGAKHCEPEYISLDKFLSKNDIESGKVYYISNLNIKKELITPLDDDDYELVCEKFDYVIIEADGSRSMPMKIPRMKPICVNEEIVGVNADTVGATHCEPAIPNNVNEIIVVVGMEAIGREIGVVCHRFNEFYGNDKYLNDNNIVPDTIVDEKLLDDFVGHYYYNPLKEKYSNAKITMYKNCFGVDVPVIKRVAIVLCASGFSKRFGSNKLLIDVGEKKYCRVEACEPKIVEENVDTVGAKHCEPATSSKKLYQIMIDKLLGARQKILESFSINEKYKDLKIDVVVVSQYDEILNDENYKDKVIMIKNENASEGLSESIKLAVEFCEGSHCVNHMRGLLKFAPTAVLSNEISVSIRPYDAVTFVNADMPLLPESELASFIHNSILNKNGIAAMYTDDVKNPAYFEKKYFEELLDLKGDKGAREILDKHFKELYKYYINDKYLVDIDEKEDLNLLNCN